jgi:hypothetical protein
LPPPVIAQNHVPTQAPPPAAPAKPVFRPPPRLAPQPLAKKAIVAASQLPLNEGQPVHPPVAKPARRTYTLPATTPAANVELMTVTVNRSKTLLIGAIAGAAFSVVLLLLLIYRSLHHPGPSLISRTMGNPPKE